VKYEVSRLPIYGFGARNPMWWGTQAFMVIEGLAMVFAIATYFYLFAQSPWWPLGPQPKLLWPSLIVALFLLSEWPNVRLKKAARAADLVAVRRGLLIMSAIGTLALILRAFELNALEIRWDENAYGSIVWFMLGLHTAHILTDLVETYVMTAIAYLGPVDMRRFPEVQDNQDYWHFVVVFWLIYYVVIYWVPRWFEVLP
jgi:heme/copper-type cytochrome/quinol oxidase subunit 3